MPYRPVGLQPGWRPGDPVEVGAIFIDGNRATLVPEASQQNRSSTVVYTFDLVRGLLTWHVVSGNGWYSARPWRLLS